jgi:hypothetical protein
MDVEPPAGGVVVVADAESDDGRARAFAAARTSAVIVLAGNDAGALGLLASALRAEAGPGARIAVPGARIALYVGAAADVALAEMIGELFGANSG